MDTYTGIEETHNSMPSRVSLGDPAPRVKQRVWYRRRNDFVCLAMLIASQSDSSFVKRHEKIKSMVWSDQSDSRFTAGISCVDCLLVSS